MESITCINHKFLCVAEGCPSECHNNGACQLFQDGWKCSCTDGWKGIDCNVAMEVECENDNDDDKGKVLFHG